MKVATLFAVLLAALLVPLSTLVPGCTRDVTLTPLDGGAPSDRGIFDPDADSINDASPSDGPSDASSIGAALSETRVENEQPVSAVDERATVE